MFSMRTVAIAATCAGAMATMGPAVAGAGVETFKDVIVRNTDDQAVPTRALGTTAVRVTNGDPLRVTSADPAPEVTPVVERRALTFSGSQTTFVHYNVPDGKVFEMDHVGFRIPRVADVVSIQVRTKAAVDDSGPVPFGFVPQAVGPNWIVNSPTRLYAVSQPDPHVTFLVTLSDPVTVSGEVVFSGRLRDA